MPELPEVETVRRTLEPRLLGRAVVTTRLHRRDMLVVPGDPPGGFSRARANNGRRPRRVRSADLLGGGTIAELVRHGKQLALVGSSGRVVCVHLGMSGWLVWRARGVRLDQADHVHAAWRLDDGSRLVFRDPRRFGGIWAMQSMDDLRRERWDALGPDALGVRAEQLRRGLGDSHRAIKAALLDQGVVAGVGNIYADEALFESRIDPRRPAGSLSADEAAALARAIRRVLARAVKARGSTLRDYRDGDGAPGAFQRAHSVYGRAGEPCRSCGAPLASGLLGQRTSVWCPACQR